MSLVNKQQMDKVDRCTQHSVPFGVLCMGIKLVELVCRIESGPKMFALFLGGGCQYSIAAPDSACFIL